MKKLLKVVLSALMVCSAISVNVYAEENKGRKTVKLTDHTILNSYTEILSTYTSGYYTYQTWRVDGYMQSVIIGCDERISGDITIPSVLGGYPVKRIEEVAFAECTGLTSVIIPEGVESMGEAVFICCKNLKSITFPKSLTKIARTTCCSCTSLTNVKIPEGVTVIGEGAFEECVSLKSITIPNGVTEIGNWAFGFCKALTNITLPNGLKWILTGAFEGCQSLSNITIPNSVNYFGGSVFRDCTSLRSISIPKGVTYIWEYAFYNCVNLRSIVIPDSLKQINPWAFYYCFNLQSITIPSGVSFIDDTAFMYCDNLTIYGKSGSEAEKYAKQHNLKFLLMGCTSGHTYNIYGKCSKCGAYASGISTAVPSMKVKSISKGKGYLTVKWAKNTKVKGYQIRYSTKSNMSGAKTVTISKYKTTSKKIKSLKRKTKYYVQIRAYKSFSGKTKYSPWSAVKNATTK